MKSPLSGSPEKHGQCHLDFIDNSALKKTQKRHLKSGASQAMSQTLPASFIESAGLEALNEGQAKAGRGAHRTFCRWQKA